MTKRTLTSQPIETLELCVHGCGQQAKFINKSRKLICSAAASSCPALRVKNSKCCKKAYEDGTKLPMKSIYQNLPQETKDKMAWSRGKTITPNEEVFCKDSYFSTEMIKDRILTQKLMEYKCLHCQIDLWHGQILTLELDHINGNNKDNRLENLRFLCPNCHSLTDTFRGRNKNTGKIKVSDQQLIEALRENNNIRTALTKVGLSPKGGNYKRAKRLLTVDESRKF